MSTDVDLVILGGGCAGLSLALRLAEQAGQPRRVEVIESRPAYRHDRSWCFWRLGPHRYEHLVKRSWSTVALRSAAQAVQVNCQRTPYRRFLRAREPSHRSQFSRALELGCDGAVAASGRARRLAH
jgi:lycopene beta-cyclase